LTPGVHLSQPRDADLLAAVCSQNPEGVITRHRAGVHDPKVPTWK
jgi:hypothetical protein